MKKILTVMVINLVLWICMSTQAEYLTEVKVTPLVDTHKFLVEFKIIEVVKNGKNVSTPKVIVKAGEEGKITIGKEENGLFCGLFCTALVKETDTGVEANTTVIVKEKGLEKLNCSQTMTMIKQSNSK